MGQHSNHTKMTTIDMPIHEHKQLKAMAAFMGISLKELVLSCVRDHLLSRKKLLRLSIATTNFREILKTGLNAILNLIGCLFISKQMREIFFERTGIHSDLFHK